MADTKKGLAIYKYLLYFILFTLPLGQLGRIYFKDTTYIYLIEILIALTIPFVVLIREKSKTNLFEKKYIFLILYIFFTYVLSLAIGKYNVGFFGAFYILRLILLIPLYLLVKRLRTDFIIRLVDVSLKISLLLGCFQYFFIPDTRFLKMFGWDDHMYRLIGTFFDPNYTGLIFVFGLIITIFRLRSSRVKLSTLLWIFLYSVGILLTYSRSSYLAYSLVIMYSMYSFSNYFKVLLFSLVVFIITIPFLPRPASQGVMLERTNSVFLRIENYKQTFSIFLGSPVFGIGYNNICSAKLNFGNSANISNSCSGSDSSLLHVLATMGIIGLFLCVDLIKTMISKTDANCKYLVASFVLAIFVHSLFVNSLFYNFVLICITVVVATTRQAAFKDYK